MVPFVFSARLYLETPMNLFSSSIETVAVPTEKPKFDFDDFFIEQWERLCEVVYHLTGDWDEAQDIALDTFIQLYRKPPQDDQNLYGWIYRVATNRGLNSLRANKRRAHYESQKIYGNSEKEHSHDPEERIERRQEKELVRKTLASMNNRSARLLVLRHSGFSYKELADIFNVSKNSIGTLLVRAGREFESIHKKSTNSDQED
jgi:RNA polymerase sigma factor (sigma-70 family)